MIHCDPSKTEYSGQIQLLLLIASQTFLRLIGIPSFLVRKVEVKVSLARTSLVNEPGKCGETIAVVYELTKRTQEKLFADWAQ